MLVATLIRGGGGGGGGGHKHNIMDRPSMPKYGTVSQVLLQLIVSFKFYFKSDFYVLNSQNDDYSDINK